MRCVNLQGTSHYFSQKIQYLLSEIVKKKYRKRPNIQSLYDFEQPIKHDKV